MKQPQQEIEFVYCSNTTSSLKRSVAAVVEVSGRVWDRSAPSQELGRVYPCIENSRCGAITKDAFVTRT